MITQSSLSFLSDILDRYLHPLTMNRKRGDSDGYADHGQHTIEPLTKRIKSPLSAITEPKLSNVDHDSVSLHRSASKYLMNGTSLGRRDSLELHTIPEFEPQLASEVYQNRKRRPRNSQEGLAPNPMADSPMPLPSNNSTNQARKKSDLSCVVCCGPAHGYNFDAISCESCKAFFRRNALFNMERLKCRRDGACEITLDTRRRCKSCRLKKCFTVGMRKEWILTEEEKVSKKRRIEENRRLRLTNMNDPLAANDVPPESSPPAEQLDEDLQSVVLDKNKSAASNSRPSRHNGDIIANVVNAFNDGFKLDPISYGWSYPLAKKVTALCQILNTKNTTALRLISFYKRLEEFDALNEVDKVNLVKNNLPFIFIFHASLGYDPINDIYHEGNSTNDMLLYGADIREAHGDNIHWRCTSILRSLHSIVQMDKRILHLALVIFLFAKGLPSVAYPKDPLLNNAPQVFQAQNFYVEHLWLFMEKCYGSERSILTFSTLISKCLLIQGLLRDIQHDIHEKLEPYQVPPIIRTLMNFS